jgi:mannose-6-phosphate isomerase-like protein (cupin superfamily)
MREPAINASVHVPAVGEPPKLIEEFCGRASNGDESMSIAVMRSPAGWSEPGQTPEFTERTAVISGTLLVHHPSGTVRVTAGNAIVAPAGLWVRYETPEATEYVSVCVPAFSPDTVHRDE